MTRHRRARRGKWGALGACGAALALAAGLLGGLGDSTEALTAPVTVTAEELSTWQTNGIVYAMAEADGLVFAGGTFSAIRPPGAAEGTQEQTANNFAVFDAATGEPTDCEMSFTVGTGTATIRAMAVSPDGETLYVGGTFGTAGGSGASSLAAIDIDTCTRTTFSASANGVVRGIAVTDDRVYLAGDFTQINSTSRSRFAAVSRTGSLVSGWVADADEPGKAVEVTPDGENVVIGGDFFTVNGEDSHALAVVDADTGDVTHSYPLGFIETASTVQDIYIDDSGIYAGNEGTGSGVFDGRIALDLDTFEQRWRDTCLGATQGVIVYGDVVYSASHAHDCSSMGEFPNQDRYHLLAQSVDDPELLGWFPNTNDGLGEAVGPRVLATATEVAGDDRDYLWVGGGFTTVNGSSQWSLTRFATSPDTGNPEAPQAHAASTEPGQIEVTWRSGVDTDDSLLTYRVYRDGGSTPVYTVQGESKPWRRPQLSYTDTNVSVGETHSYRITATDGAGNTSSLSTSVSATVASSTQPYVESVQADNPMLYWRYDETANNFASDASGNASNGTHRGGPTRGATPGAVDGPQAAAVGYDGTDSYTYSDRSYSGVQQYTLETWFNTTTTEGGKLIGMGNRILQDSSSRDNNLYMLNDGRLRFALYNGAYRTATSTQSYNDGEWHHVAASIGSRGLELYVDGVKVATNTRVTSARNLTNHYWRTGGDSLSGWPDRPTSDYFAGQLDETAIYGSQLSSARITAHIDAASEPIETTQSVSPTADTYVNGAATSSNYGSDSKLAVRGSSAYESYLAFDLPDAPAGTELKSVTLSVTTTSDSTAGSTNSFSVVPVTGSWTETGTTYSSRPSLGSTVLGTLSSPSQTSTTYSITLDADAVSAALGGEYDVALTSTGTDSLWLWSSEYSGSSSRPQLQLTFEAP